MTPLNQTAYVILGLLSVEPNLSGYDIRKAIQSSVGYFWSESYGQIYPALKRLTAEGLIAPGSTASNGRKRRQVYVLTEAGRTCLRHWLALPFQNDPPRNEFLLKLFFGRMAAPGVSAAHVRDLQERNRRMLATLREIEMSAPVDQSSNPNLPYWLLTLSLGKALTQAALEWGERAMATLSAAEASAGATPQTARSKPKKKASTSRKTALRKGGFARSQSTKVVFPSSAGKSAKVRA